jgi:hypothetical protein
MATDFFAGATGRGGAGGGVVVFGGGFFVLVFLSVTHENAFGEESEAETLFVLAGGSAIWLR